MIKTIPPIIFPNNLNVKEIKGEKLPAISIGLIKEISCLIFLYAKPNPKVTSQVTQVAAKTTDKLLPIGAKPNNEIKWPKNKKQKSEIK